MQFSERLTEPVTTAWELQNMFGFGGIAAFGVKPFRPSSEIKGYYIAKLAKISEMTIEYAEEHIRNYIRSPLRGLYEKRRRRLFLSAALSLVESGALSAAFSFLFFTIAMKGLFYGKSGMTA